MAMIPQSNAVWAPFLEKIWAKVNGNYEHIISGDASDALDFLVGVPGRIYRFKEQD